MFVVDSFALFLKLLFLFSACPVIMLSVDYLAFPGAKQGEYYCLILFSVIGMMLLASANDLLSLFLGLQLVSIPLYILAGFQKFDARSNEASLKYLLLGMIASVIMLYGMSMIYGITGDIHLNTIAKHLTGRVLEQPALFLSIIFILTGFIFKVAAAPFHFWAPDVYEGSPTPISAFFASCPKVAGFAALLRILIVALPGLKSDWTTIFALISVLSMTIGNLVALGQTNIKRMLAYSSIAHVGYIFISFAVASQRAFAATVFYLAMYVCVTIGAFAVIVATTKISPEHVTSDLAGLAKRAPFLAISMTIFMMSLLGLPPTPGFWAKLSLFIAAVDKGLIWLALVAVINSVISLYYYVNVVRYIYVEPGETTTFKVPMLVNSVVVLTLALTVLLGAFPEVFIELSRKATILTLVVGLK
jgi:NADH-quinone oxidoreductase subunit N